MFFGKPKPSEIGIEEGERMLGELFVGKLGAWPSKMERLGKELAAVQSQLCEACDRFDQLSAEPYMENLFWMDPQSVKRHKGAYARALKNVIERFEFENNAQNPYQRYESILSDAEGMNGEMLKTNATFKQVLYCYSPHIGDFKRISSQLERLLLEIRSELSRKSAEYGEYESVSENLSKLKNYLDEMEDVNRSIEALSASLGRGDKDAIKERERKLLYELDAKKKEAQRIEGEEKALANKVHSTVSVLGRASKKFDHISHKKLKLNPFVESPFERINSEEDYKEFAALLLELKEDLGKLDIKNGDEVLRSVADIGNSDFYYAIGSVRSARSKKAMAYEEVELTQRMLNELRKSEDDMEMRLVEKNSMEKELERIKSLINEGKEMVEKQFRSYYGRPIVVRIHSKPRESSP